MGHNIVSNIDCAHLIVTAAEQVASNAAAIAWDPDAGAGDWFIKVRLSADGEEPATHYGASSVVTRGMKIAIDAWKSAPDKRAYYDSGGYTFGSAAADAGLIVIGS